tara:strand:+ start:2482 stop:2829 length:348 start_codon:yes stop_codon:yes gene_type:complete
MGCPQLLTTDWFARADPSKPGSDQALNECWRAVVSEADAPLWVWPFDDRSLWPLVAGIERLEHALEVDPRGLSAFLDLGALVQVDACYENNHIGRTISDLRGALGKPRTVHSSVK